MKRLRDFLVAGVVVPALLVGQLPAAAQPAPDPKKPPAKTAPAAAKPAPAAARPAPAAAKPATSAGRPVPGAAAKPAAPAARPAPAAKAAPPAAKPVAPAAAARPAAPAAARPAAPAAAARPAAPARPLAPTSAGRPIPGKPAPVAAPRPGAPGPVMGPGGPARPDPRLARPPVGGAPAVARPVQPMAPQVQQVRPDQAIQPMQPVRRDGGIGPAGAAAIGLGVGLVGGYVLSNQMRGVTEVHTQRQTVVEGGVTYVREPGRVIIREPGGPVYIRHNETERFAILGYKPIEERQGATIRTIYDRPDGTRIITVTDGSGRLLRRIRRFPNGREVIIIDNSFRPPPRTFVEQVVMMPPPPMTIPRERYIVDAARADRGTIYEALTAPPLAPVKRRYTLDEVRYSPDLRAQMRSVDVNTITFESGSWEVTRDQVDRLGNIASAIDKAIQANPQEVFLVEGHTDAVGDTDDNLSLSDRRAQAVAEILTRDFNIPAENLTTQGYGETQLRVTTDGAARENRRVTVRRITPLLAGNDQGQTPADAQAPADGQQQ